MSYQDIIQQLASYFDENTMSVHCKPDQLLMQKKWLPWKRVMHTADIILSKKDIRDLMNSIIAASYSEETERTSSDSVFIEIERKYSQVIQCGPYRIVYTRPPVSSVTELTIVRPLKKVSLEQYTLDEHVVDSICNPNNGVLIAWSPWEGKSTFAQAVTAALIKQQLVIKTIEAPRDLQVDPRITQLSFFHASHPEIKDILLLSRPDLTIFDEVRNTDDFHLYKDLRLAWIGMIGVMHATLPIDALQRFLHAVDLWSAAHVINYIIFIKWWCVQQILQLQQTVKVPMGMLAEDLARPVIEVIDVITRQITHEVYSYGEQVVVMPLETLPEKAKLSPILKHAEISLEKSLREQRKCPVSVTVDSPTSITVAIPDTMKGEIIGRQWTTIKKREQELWFQIHIQTLEHHDILRDTWWWKKYNKKPKQRRYK